ncbi:small G protein signaling modulator 3 homolog isoform X2 [Copidosoma floridanum]|uniref:small G protein signaling modulator 3 homolog isoform X2 n=1 Tax=Copidosoma floridanum TaxID=29053 RepID=UPI0006C9DCC9|nr:small G protein signaling modulator 3 homolog isoform X2 [Copidosoma floridanum]
MDIAKSLFNVRDHDGYVGKDDHNKNLETAVSDDEFDIDSNGLNGEEALSPTPGGAFSALTPSMWPQDMLAKLNQPSNPDNPTDEYKFDEFGFKVDEEDAADQNAKKLINITLAEDPQQRLQWVSVLEFNHNKDVSEFTWQQVENTLTRTEKLREMVHQGIPHSLRPQVWMRMSGALQKKVTSETTYRDIVKASSSDALMTSKQIEKDLLRTMPTNACFNNLHSTGIPRLRRVLRGLAWLYPDIGYCQGTGFIAASLLLLLEEEDAFWMLATIVEDLLPASYYSSTLIGIQADQRVLRSLITNYLPNIDQILTQHDIELSLITLNWFLTLFASVVHMKILLRLWDLFLCDGSIVLFQITLGMLKIKETELKDLENSAQIFNALSDIPGDIIDVDQLLDISFKVSKTLTNALVETHRRRHLAYLMVDQGGLVGNPEAVPNLPKQHLNRRQLKRSKSMLQSFLFGSDETEDDIKCKNIRQTEILVDLRESVLQVSRHFINLDPKYSNISLTADYSMESHAKDHDNYINVSRTRKRRAKALLDFERHDDDELGFRKNDIITIISQKDEHCWVGELNGLRAKFVELLDERSKQYTCVGDDAVSEAVTDLVRGGLCPAVKAVLEQGMKRPSFLGGPCHPWLFIEEASNREVEKDFNSVYSRLILCKTYRLDEDGKVLTPEELLYRCVQSINLTHDNAHAQMDVKLRSLICLGLNEQVLHLWLEVLCSCIEVVQKWYHPWSFVNSPGWVQIKCELRTLSQFAFNLNPDWELPPKKEQSQPLKDGVRDMLVKHHLFSWDL